MRTAQKVIKIFALCLAGVIIISIFGAIVSGISFVGMLVDGDGWAGESTVIWEGESNTQAVRRLEISAGATSLQIVESQNEKEVRVETNNEYITTWQDGNTLKVVEKSHGFFGFQGKMDLTVYVPKGSEFEGVDIDAGAGTVIIERLVAKRVKMELGAGRTQVKYLEVSEKAEIDGGAGSLELNEGKIKNLDLEIGAGKADVRAEIRGNSRIESGVGKLDLDLEGKSSEYKITIDKGIGSVTIDGNKQSDGAIYGEGENLIRISSGVGAVEIRTNYGRD